jgi:ABC-type uncharacterized transport system substrate-binding protein
MKTIGTFTSYELCHSPNHPSKSVQGLIDGLAECGFRNGTHYKITMSHSNRLEDHYRTMCDWFAAGRVDILFCGGTPIAWVIRQAISKLGSQAPLIYFGAHPIDGSHEVGMTQVAGPDTVCVRMQLPLTFHYRTFRILRLLFPRLERVHIPFARNTVFCHPAMARRYDSHRTIFGPYAWIESDMVGFKSIKDLCWVIDATYREYPLHSSEELRKALNTILPRGDGEIVRDIIVAFNDTYHVEGAPATLLQFSTISRVPVVWVNNAAMARHGAIADFCNPFESVAKQAAAYVAEYLSGRWTPGRYECIWNDSIHYTLNRKTASILGIPQLRWDQVERSFHQVIR